jgi:hypothetical protein
MQVALLDRNFEIIVFHPIWWPGCRTSPRLFSELLQTLARKGYHVCDCFGVGIATTLLGLDLIP